ncbi:MAG TPA: ABC transporter permease, partial [Candidatus Hydrogenedentes bacterium]|nr:ABC transporter permease [Candidatus Hydrogenedentota bacterium]
MSLWHIAWSYLWNRKLTTALTVVSVALGVSLISAVLTLRDETQRRFEEEGQAFDIVVGAKGNPLQLVLSTVYFLDAPTGNMDFEIFETLKGHEDVVAAFPIGMGDSYGGYRIIGTTRDLMDFSYGERAPYALASGRYFEAPFEAVVGANVAQDTGLKMGDTFVGTHGLVNSASAEVHDDFPYTVVGILERSGSPNDRGIFCDLQSVWNAHDHGHGEEHGEEGHHHGEEITAALIKLASPALRAEFKDGVNRTSNAMAAVPIWEIQKLY